MSNNPIALITGAGSGIGRAVAQQLAAAGYNLALLGRSLDKLQETAALARPLNVETLTISADLADANECRRAIQETVAYFGRIDALANVAGYAALVPIAKVTDDLWRSTIDINLSTIVHLTAAAWPHLKTSGGIVVNVSSMASIDPFPNFAIYAAAKAAVNMFTLCTAREGARQNIRAVAIAPGAVETPMLRSMFNEKMIPASKALPPGDVAKVIVDCITGKRAFAAGETIAVPSP
jgi:NAD(P)-dependent dehydrogenase (short-subunit alcohol dehydrogenase family)